MTVEEGLLLLEHLLSQNLAPCVTHISLKERDTGMWIMTE
jgi:hypothetical protein